MNVIYGKFNNSDTSASIMKTNGRSTVVINKPLAPTSEKHTNTPQVLDYASDEIGAFFMSACKRK